MIRKRVVEDKADVFEMADEVYPSGLCWGVCM